MAEKRIEILAQIAIKKFTRQSCKNEIPVDIFFQMHYANVINDLILTTENICQPPCITE